MSGVASGGKDHAANANGVFAGTLVELPSIGPKDEEALRHALAHGVDFVRPIANSASLFLFSKYV